MLRAGEADVALSIETPGSCTAPPEGIVLEPLLDDHMYAVLPVDHRLARRRRVRLEDLADDPWIIGSNSGTCPDARIVLQACGGAGFEPRVVFQNDDYPAIQGFIAAGVGVSLIPELALHSVRDDVVVLPLTGRPLFRRIVAATLADGWDSPAKARMIEVLREVGEEFAGRRGELRLTG
jgi:DNA-binding transcriptional LysR family regulator